MRRCLIVANQTLLDSPLLTAIHARQASDHYEFHLLVPAFHPPGAGMWTEGQARARAHARLDQARAHLRAEGIETTGEIGDENPVQAVGDVLNRERFDEIIVSTLPPGVSRWLKRDLPNRIARRHGLPVTHVVATPAPVG